MKALHVPSAISPGKTFPPMPALPGAAKFNFAYAADKP